MVREKSMILRELKKGIWKERFERGMLVYYLVSDNNFFSLNCVVRITWLFFLGRLLPLFLRTGQLFWPDEPEDALFYIFLSSKNRLK